MRYPDDPSINLSLTTQLQAVVASSDNRSYAYDANGNMTRRTVAGVASDLKYDAENHLIQQGSTTYRYDGDGKLVAKLLANGTRVYYLGNTVELSYSATQSPTATARATWTALPSPTLLPTASPTATGSPTASRTPTVPKTPTRTPTSPTATKTLMVATRTQTLTPTLHRTSTRTPTVTLTATRTPNLSLNTL